MKPQSVDIATAEELPSERSEAQLYAWNALWRKLLSDTQEDRGQSSAESSDGETGRNRRDS